MVQGQLTRRLPSALFSGYALRSRLEFQYSAADHSHLLHVRRRRVPNSLSGLNRYSHVV